MCLVGKKESLIRQMSSPGCILVTSYVGAVQHQEALLARDWHYVILDEGHKIRNPDAQVGIRGMNECAFSHCESHVVREDTGCMISGITTVTSSYLSQFSSSYL